MHYLGKWAPSKTGVLDPWSLSQMFPNKEKFPVIYIMKLETKKKKKSLRISPSNKLGRGM